MKNVKETCEKNGNEKVLVKIECCGETMYYKMSRNALEALEWAYEQLDVNFEIYECCDDDFEELDF